MTNPLDELIKKYQEQLVATQQQKEEIKPSDAKRKKPN